MGQVPRASADAVSLVAHETPHEAGRASMGSTGRLARSIPFTRYLIVGGGRAARHFAEYFRLQDLPFEIWRRADVASEAVSEPSRSGLGERQRASLQEAITRASHVALAVSDRAIEPILTMATAELEGKGVVHFSGALETPLAPGAHPLMTFSERLSALEEYRQIWFALEEGRGDLADLLPGIPNPSFSLKAGQRPLYHAWCALSGNLTAFVWSAFFDRLEREFGAPREAAFPYLRRQALNLELDGARAITGPLARGDGGTVAKHLAALRNDSFLPIYQGFAATFAREQERLKSENLEGGSDR